MVWLVLACWQPDAYAPPPPAQVEASDVLEGTASQIVPGAPAVDSAEPEAAPDSAADGPGDSAEPEVEAPAPPPPPVAVAVSPWAGRTVGRPLTLVDDAGAPLRVLGDAVAVTVLMEGDDRVKVRCDGCSPPVEGWLQKRAVQR